MRQLRRSSPRIPYEETVCLTRVDGGGRLFGRSVNLGVAGMYVVCIEPCEIGTELVCSVLLPGGPRKVRARVTRLTALPRGVGIALAFHDITNHDRVVIESLIAAHRREVHAKLRLEGAPEPVPCEAVVDERVVHLTTTLPLLRLDKGVEVVLGDHDEVETTGTISRIAIDPAQPDGIPRLSLDVELAGRPASGANDAGALPPSALPRPCGHPIPSVVISKTLEREALERAAAAGRPRPAHRSGVTAEIARPARFTDWTPPPAVAARAGRTMRHPLGGWNRHPARSQPQPLPARASRAYLLLVLILPAAAALAALLIRRIG